MGNFYIKYFFNMNMSRRNLTWRNIDNMDKTHVTIKLKILNN